VTLSVDSGDSVSSGNLWTVVALSVDSGDSEDAVAVFVCVLTFP